MKIIFQNQIEKLGFKYYLITSIDKMERVTKNNL